MSGYIHASGLVKRYGEVTALDGLDLDVERGTVLGLLGPNGAGKTTAVRILATLLVPDEGTVSVAGKDPLTDPQAVRELIGLSGQSAAVDEVLTGFENLDMVGRLYSLGRTASVARARELLEQFDLTDAGDRPVKTYSGGMRRRLDLAAALVAKPDVVFLDEPTTGLDPRSRTDLWAVIRELVDDGTTVLLTTQYLEEADRLADEIVVIDHGQAIARGTADQLKLQVGGERIEVVVADAALLAKAAEILGRKAIGDVSVDPQRRSASAAVDGGPKALQAILRAMERAEIDLNDVGLRRPTLDDVFLSLTGQGTESADGAEVSA